MPLGNALPPAPMQARAVSSAAFAFTASLRRLASPRRVVAAGTLVPPARPTRRPATTAPMASSPSSSGLVTDTFFLDDFAMRQWDDPNYGGTKIDFDKAAFVARVHDAHASGEAPLVDGYAPFCKHVFVRNFVPGTKVGAVEITPDNEHLLRSGYSARSDAELPVLTRWFPQEKIDVPDATWLDVILYSREQLELERAAVPSKAAPAAPGRAVGDHLGQGPDRGLRVPDDAHHDHEERAGQGRGRERGADRSSGVREERRVPSETRAARQGGLAQRGVSERS